MRRALEFVMIAAVCVAMLVAVVLLVQRMFTI
jgi:hypothetical protein